MIDRPTFVLEKDKLKKNIKILRDLASKSGAKFLYTLKGFDKKKGLKYISLDGFSISNLSEFKKISKDTHIHSYSLAFQDIKAISKISTTLSFNSLTQYKSLADKSSKYTSIGLRINPQIRLKQYKSCDTSRKKNRFGVDYKEFIKRYNRNEFANLEGLHFHIFCYQDTNSLNLLINHIDKNYKHILKNLKWINLGGGQNFTHKDYDIDKFIQIIQQFKTKHPHIEIIFEPSSAVLKDIGYFKTTIVDIIDDIAILNTSIETHLLDIAITKYKPKISNTTKKKTPHQYTLSGMSCIANDTIGTYYFKEKLHIGDTIIIKDMLAYTLVKQTTFNSIVSARFEII